MNLDCFPDPEDQNQIPQPPQEPSDRIVKGEDEFGDRINTGNPTRDTFNQDVRDQKNNLR